jgi:hypothetical protein
MLGLGVVSATTADPSQSLISSMDAIPTGGLTINGVIGGGAPWVINQGTAILTGDGHLVVRVNGLVLSSNHTNPLANGRAIVTCNGQAPITTDSVPFSPAGNAFVATTIRLPSPCLSPTVFFAGITGAGDRWLAVTGL